MVVLGTRLQGPAGGLPKFGYGLQYHHSLPYDWTDIRHAFVVVRGIARQWSSSSRPQATQVFRTVHTLVLQERTA